MTKPNYDTSKEPSAKPPIESAAGYATGQAPRAATYGKGARDLSEIADAAQRRRDHSAELSRKPVGPQSLANHNSKRK